MWMCLKDLIRLILVLIQLSYDVDQVVVTGTKTFKRKVESPVIVNVIDGRQLESVQACNLAEGLNFQPGIRIETDCQTCNIPIKNERTWVVILRFLLMDVLYFHLLQDCMVWIRFL